MSLQTREYDLYRDVWTSVDGYGAYAPGEQYVDMFVQQAISEAKHVSLDQTVLDAGCGTGKGGVALTARGFLVTLCDVTADGLVKSAQALPFHRACLWSDLRLVARGVGHPGRTTFDFVYCCDVLEHIPPQFTMLVVDQLLRVARYGVFLSVSLVPDSFGVWVGQSLHQTVQSFMWWKESLQELGTVTDARDLHQNAVFFVRPR